ncbi:fluoride efflux transporter CrcB [Paenibacillus koleovorans]|uniref:fluoride efflux transporter CrcB n=1 Tax=Paenibacillus koleovorans TaxID=121608 RepID=UPI001FE6A923|nr:fluoride efflux transporter CrcB [Paenibacillus koleovorans]
MTILYIGLAGVVGALMRYGFGLLLVPYDTTELFPLATLLINYSGCFGLAWLLYSPLARSRLSERFRTVIGTGVIGSYTTFSAFSAETVLLLDRQAWGAAIAYIVLSAAGGYLFAWLGERIALRRTSIGSEKVADKGTDRGRP